ncbi:hypothetical protein FPCIR_2636 [Fusarium pseudocircinatum]|uniref:Uncharacterized protein n=1 Tax=Fusarium pseudocircinatum TaxID=56676 RepID=A0A8H5PL25_9HYPO|nr:hypothetical protein FPCIR_2636 [Fusarium pseudocircinatum]
MRQLYAKIGTPYQESRQPANISAEELMSQREVRDGDGLSPASIVSAVFDCAGRLVYVPECNAGHIEVPYPEPVVGYYSYNADEDRCMDDAGSAVPQIEECIGGARMISAREDHIKPSFPSDGLVGLVDDIMSGLGHVPPLHMTRSAVRTLQVCSEGFLVEVFTAWTRSSNRSELTEDDTETFKDTVRRLQDYTLLKSERASGNRNKGCPSAPSTLCRDSTPDRRVFSEPRTLKKERKEQNLLRRSAFLCTLPYDAGNNEQPADANHTFEVTLSGQLTCCPHGLSIQMIQHKDGNKKPTNDCFCSGYGMFDSNDGPPMEMSQDRDGAPLRKIRC